MDLNTNNVSESLVLLALEDVNLLVWDNKTQDYALRASVTLFPIGWTVRSKLDSPVPPGRGDLHKAVSNWGLIWAGAAESMYKKWGTDPSRVFTRTGVFILVGQNIVIKSKEDKWDSLKKNVSSVEDLYFKREFQVFKKLPGTISAYYFTVYTSILPVNSLDKLELISAYKYMQRVTGKNSFRGVKSWGPVLEAYLKDS